MDRWNDSNRDQAPPSKFFRIDYSYFKLLSDIFEVLESSGGKKLKKNREERFRDLKTDLGLLWAQIAIVEAIAST